MVCPRWCVGWGLWHEARPVPAVSQHLAPDPQLQQSIRLLQLSTLELGQEVEQMLDENPFLERATDEAPREEFGLEHANAPAQPTTTAPMMLSIQELAALHPRG